MRMELKSVRYNEKLSDETACFSASIYIDGSNVGEARNTGTGGATEVMPWALAEQLNAYAATLPPDTYEHNGITHSFPRNAESLIDEAFEQWHRNKEQRQFATRLSTRLISVRGGAVYESKRVTPAQLATWLPAVAVRAEAEGYTSLNHLPPAEAWDIYARAVGLVSDLSDTSTTSTVTTR
jgi:hypothetical protein